MITIFCDFSQFSAKKMAFFLNANVMINFFQNLALARVKNAKCFAIFFGENILKIITSVPGAGGVAKLSTQEPPDLKIASSSPAKVYGFRCGCCL
jgi:hypothetical protein